MIAKRDIIARLSYNTSFGLYEKVDFLNRFLTKSRMLPLLAHIDGVRAKLFPSKFWRKMAHHYGI